MLLRFLSPQRNTKWKTWEPRGELHGKIHAAQYKKSNKINTTDPRKAKITTGEKGEVNSEFLSQEDQDSPSETSQEKPFLRVVSKPPVLFQ